jgi:hypothetical protein
MACSRGRLEATGTAAVLTGVRHAYGMPSISSGPPRGCSGCGRRHPSHPSMA